MTAGCDAGRRQVYVKIIDYKTGNTSFDLVSIYYGLQMQLVVYMDAAMQAEQRKHPDCQGKTGRNLLLQCQRSDASERNGRRSG